jgi:hypothetical protein
LEGIRMSTLVLVLAAGTAMGNGPEKVSGEVEQRLDLSGKWEGVWWFYTDGRLQVSSRDSCLVGVRKPGADNWVGSSIDTCNFIDEGHGKLRGTWDLTDREIYGIYRQDGERLLLCFSEAPYPWPTSFQVGDGQFAIIIRRVKPGK